MPHPQLSALFERALDVPADRRTAFLDSACGGDAPLRRELESLLEAHDSAGGYFENLAERIGVPTPGDGLDTSARASVDLLQALQSDLADTYRIERELGGGGMSRVFLAEEVALKRRVVIKTLPPEMAAAVNVDRFRREIAVIAQLQHPHIVPLLTANATGLLLYYTMPFVAGESLRDRLASGGALSVDDALRVWRDVLDALAYAHANGVVHRDVKPANILLSGRNAMVADFGIARAIEAAAGETLATMTGPIGTPAYMAPEQASGAKLDHRADLYAAGLVMYEMLVARPPFQAASAREFVLAHMLRDPEPLRRSDLPPRLVELVMQCLAKEPSARPESAEALLAQLDVIAGPRSAIGLTSRARRILAAAVAGVAIATAAFGAWRMSPSARGGLTSSVAHHTPPDSALRLYQRGIFEHKRRTVEGDIAALALFDRAIALDSEFSQAWAGRARAAQFASSRGWTLLGRRPDSLLALAVRASRRAVQLDSSSAEAWTVAGKVASAVDLEDRGATLHALQRALAIDSNYAEAWFELGLAQEEALRPAEAERAWLRAATLAPANAQVLGFLGVHYLWYDNFPAGKRWADSAIAVDPTYFLARDAAAFLALAMHDPAQAVRHAEASQRASGHEPPIPPAILATAAARSGDLKLARHYALQAEAVLADRRGPSKHEAAYLGIAWAAVGDTARAIRWMSAYTPRGDLHYQLHLKREPDLRWIAKTRPALLTP
jgi:tRNA A-37 threonylcarbamoyl transferase component Bud32/tetratricopeptide (TPR) repeat protein